MKKFNEFIQENTFYTNDIEKAEFVKSKENVANAFLFNFFGMLGLLNATKPAQQRQVTNFLKRDKKVRLFNIDDTNHDISLSVKLANEAGFFRSTTTANEITKFLALLKTGAVTTVDSAVVRKWIEQLSPAFWPAITDYKARTALKDFRDDPSKDLSFVAIQLKKRANKLDHTGEFKEFAKRFPQLVDKTSTATPATTDNSNTTTDSTSVVDDPVVDAKDKTVNTTSVVSPHFQRPPYTIPTSYLNLFVTDPLYYNRDSIKTRYNIPADLDPFFQELAAIVKELLFININVTNRGYDNWDDVKQVVDKYNPIINDLWKKYNLNGLPDITDITVYNLKRYIRIYKQIEANDSISNDIYTINNITPAYIGSVVKDLDKNQIDKLLTDGWRLDAFLIILVYLYKNTKDDNLKSFDVVYNNDSFMIEFQEGATTRLLDSSYYNSFGLGLTLDDILTICIMMAKNKKVSSYYRNVGRLNKTIRDKIILETKDKFLETGLKSLEDEGYVLGTLKNALTLYGVSIEEYYKKHPSDRDAKIMVDPDAVTADDIEAKSKAASQSIITTLTTLMHQGILKKENGVDLMIKCIEADKQNLYQRNTLAFSPLMADASKDQNIRLLRALKKTNKKSSIDIENYKDAPRYKKPDYISFITNLLLDAIDSDVEDFIDDIISEFPQNITQKIRGNILGSGEIIKELEDDPIKPFTKVDSTRLKQIFTYNEIDFSSIVSSKVSRKKKSETYSQYIKRVQSAVAGGVLPLPKVTENTTLDKKKINKMLIDNYHAGKHGDIYPVILKIFDADVSFPEFDQFKSNPSDGSIVPSFHGTGGIAASMILRFGFKVIPSSDPSAVGRMLGDGIYFSNKIDKALQYVSNGGYGRNYGSKGYIFEMENNLGKRPKNYSDQRDSGRNLVSPEWCVRDPKAQLKIVRVYEVELQSRATVNRYLNEQHDFKDFKTFLKESSIDFQKQTGFIFRDGMIPVMDNNGELHFLPADQAIEHNHVKSDEIEYLSIGPMRVFKDTDQQIIHDVRWASGMNYDQREKYKQLLQKNLTTDLI